MAQASVATQSSDFPKLPGGLLTRFEEGSYITRGSIVEAGGQYFIIALWRNRSAPSEVPWRIPSQDYLQKLKNEEPFKMLMSSLNLASNEVLVPDEGTLLTLARNCP